jgi:hypothetical protein
MKASVKIQREKEGEKEGRVKRSQVSAIKVTGQ